MKPGKFMASIAEKLSPSHLAKVQRDPSLLVLPSEHTESASSMGFAVSFSQEYVVVSFESKHGRYMAISHFLLHMMINHGILGYSTPISRQPV